MMTLEDTRWTIHDYIGSFQKHQNSTRKTFLFIFHWQNKSNEDQLNLITVIRNNIDYL